MGLRLNLKTKATEQKQGGFRRVESIGFADQDASKRIASSRVPEIPAHTLHWNVSGLSPDRTLSAVAEVIGQGRIRISVRAFAPESRNSSVIVVLRSKTAPTVVWLSKEITLNLNDGWIGHWSGPIGNAFHPADAAIAVMSV